MAESWAGLCPVGPNPFGHHLTSVVLHGLNAMLVFLVMVQLLLCAGISWGSRIAPAQAIPAAAVTALLFGLHPLRVESVAWVSERKDLLCAFFVLLSILTYITYTAARSGGKRLCLFVVSIDFAVLALMSKPMAVSLPSSCS